MNSAYSYDRFLPVHHDHHRCVTSAMRQAETLCAQRGVRLTPTRRQVLDLLWRRHAPTLAYDLIDQLRQRTQKSIAPPTVYRALEFLLDQGLIHRIESLNAFVGCPIAGEHHTGQFFICERCGSVAELADDKIDALIRDRGIARGFTVKRQMVEIHGCCPDCQ